MSTYARVQFIGYAISSIPLDATEVGDPNGPTFVEGRYVGIDPEPADIDARIDLVMKAVRQTVKSGAVDPSAATLKIFVLPEFVFRGKSGAYEAAGFTYFRTQFAKRVGTRTWKDWLFVTGTIVNTAANYVRGRNRKRDLKARVRENLAMALADAWQFATRYHDEKLAGFLNTTLDAYTAYCHVDPVYEVLDRSYVIAGGPRDASYPEGLSVQKKFESNEDFVLNLHTNVFSEDESGYPPIDESHGENKRTAFDDLSIFTIKGIKFGVEVCLDHYQARLRRDRSSPSEHVQIHIIPSCGMQIEEPAVIACAGGLVFNCDGQYAVPDPGSKPGVADSVWARASSNRSHTQLAQVVTACKGKDPTCDMAVLAKPAARVRKIPIAGPSASKLFAYGAGEVHVYTPLAVPPPVPERAT
jgi:hypothetical protein